MIEESSKETYLEPKWQSAIERFFFFFWMYLQAYYFRNKSTITYVRLDCIPACENIKSEAKVEQIIAIVTTCSVSCFSLNDYKKIMIMAIILAYLLLFQWLQKKMIKRILLQEMITTKLFARWFFDFIPGWFTFQNIFVEV